MSLRKIGITGATGLLGGRFLRLWTIDNPDVQMRCLARNVADHFEHPSVEWMSGDLMNEADCVEFIEGLDAVAHFAQSNCAGNFGSALAERFGGKYFTGIEFA